MSFSQDQLDAIESFKEFMLSDKEQFMVLTGPGGVGKTYLAQEFLNLAKDIQELVNSLIDEEGYLNYAITALTHKAASVLELSMEEDVSTIHSYLNLRPFTDYKTGEKYLKKTKDFCPKENTLIFVDEVSMLTQNMLKILQSSTQSCKVVLIGDDAQLLDVKDKSTPAFTQGYRTARLDTLHRVQKIEHEGQKIVNPIKPLSFKLRDVVYKKAPFFDLKAEAEGIAIHAISGKNFKKLAEAAFMAFPDGKHTKILAWSNKRVMEYNDHIRLLFSASHAPYPGETLVSNGLCYSAYSYEKTAAIKNNQVVTIKDIKPDVYREIEGYRVTLTTFKSVFVAKDYNDVKALMKEYKRSKEWVLFYELKENIADLRPVFSSTVHKSQGSTYSDVFIDLNDIGRCNMPNEVARMLYVAISRAKRNVYLVGSLPEKYGG